ncbi:enoyl-CoA hydratase-related protein [Streptomyces sp. NPDC056431]|uniref:enoyl-CoA hydratase-related protein n=1 Tax=Streptomyces sp. NPDC056431 TaxID=3345814 RepID=UPI00368AC8D3
MRILLVSSSFNSLTQRVWAELGDRGHTVPVEVTADGGAVREAVARHAPDLVVAPMLKAVVPRDVWRAHRCLIVHPGPVGDRGPSSLDHAIHDGAREWGVTVLQADEEMDAGDVWATATFRVPEVGKSDLYRNELADAAVAAVLLAVERAADGAPPRPQTGEVRVRPVLRQEERRISWDEDATETVLRTLRAADSQPGVPDRLLGAEWFLHGGHAEDGLRGRPGALLATRAGAVCRATVDGAVWIPELRARTGPGMPRACKLPATLALAGRLPELPELPAPADPAPGRRTWSDIRYREQGPVGVLSFAFPSGAMSTDQCRRLLDAYETARGRPTSVLVLGGQRDFFSNGIHLNVIEAAVDPAAESWANINAMNDLVEAVLTTTDRLVVSAIGGNAAAGGVMLALAADEVWCRSGSVLNPHYRRMGLYGSEYWTRTLPGKVGDALAARLTEEASPVSAAASLDMGLVDRVVDCGPGEFTAEVTRLALQLASHRGLQPRIAAKKAEHECRESVLPLAVIRERELARMQSIFADPTASYHARRRAFVRKEAPERRARMVQVRTRADRPTVKQDPGLK